VLLGWNTASIRLTTSAAGCLSIAGHARAQKSTPQRHAFRLGVLRADSAGQATGAEQRADPGGAIPAVYEGEVLAAHWLFLDARAIREAAGATVIRLTRDPGVAAARSLTLKASF